MSLGQLSWPWQVWIGRALLRGRTEGEIVAALGVQGVPESVVRQALEGFGDHPLCEAILEEGTVAATQTAAMQVQFQQAGTGRVPRVELTPEQWWDGFVAGNRPVVIPGLARDWPILSSWRMQALKDREGHVALDFSLGREALDHPDVSAAASTVRGTLADLIDRCQDPSSGNDVYLVSRQRALHGPLRHLAAELVCAAAWTMPEDLPEGANLWIGPAGVRTSAHHDPTNTLFVQIEGRKRFWLAPPSWPEPGRGGSGYYAGRPLRELKKAHPSMVLTAEVGPGDAIFLPCGWWHEVQSLSPTVSVGLTNLRLRNRFEGLPLGGFQDR